MSTDKREGPYQTEDGYWEKQCDTLAADRERWKKAALKASRERDLFLAAIKRIYDGEDMLVVLRIMGIELPGEEWWRCD